MNRLGELSKYVNEVEKLVQTGDEPTIDDTMEND